jgi:hypothetical protein
VPGHLELHRSSSRSHRPFPRKRRELIARQDPASRWQQCLDLNAEVTASTWQRGAGVHEHTRTRFNDAGPLIELGRLAEAGRLADCQQVFEDHRDTAAAVSDLPSTVAVAVAELTEGVRLGELLAALEPDLRAVEEALAGILRAAAEPSASQGQARPGERGTVATAGTAARSASWSSSRCRPGTMVPWPAR